MKLTQSVQWKWRNPSVCRRDEQPCSSCKSVSRLPETRQRIG
jgi:hypothetical protein